MTDASPDISQPDTTHPAIDREAAKRVIFLTVFLDILGFGIIIPQLGAYAAQFGGTPLLIGILASSYSTAQFICAPLLGRLSDRIGRRPVLLWSIFGTAMGYVLFALAHSMPLLFAARVIDGITGGNISTAQAYLSDITEPEERAKTFGFFGAIFGIGFALGPAIGSVLSHLPGVWGTNLGIGAFTAGLSLVNWLLALKRLPESLNPEMQQSNIKRDTESGRRWQLINVHGFSRALSIPGLNRLIVVSFFSMVAFATLQGTYTIFLITRYVRPQVQQLIRRDPEGSATLAQHVESTEKSVTTTQHGDVEAPTASAVGGADVPFPSEMGGDFELGQPPPNHLTWRAVEKTLVTPQATRFASNIFITIGIFSLLVQGGLIGPLRKQFGEVNMILAGTVIMAASLALVALPHLAWWQFPIMALLAFGNGIAGPVITALVSQLAPEAERGEIIGVFQSVQSLGRVCGPMLGGLFFHYFSPAAPFLAGGAIMMISFAMALGLRRTPALHEVIAGPVMTET